MKKIGLIQWGARRQYEVPRSLIKQNQLEWFVTDLYFTEKEASFLRNISIKVPPLRILPRELETVSHRKIVWFFLLKIALLFKVENRLHPIAVELAHRAVGLYLILTFKKKADVIYSMFGEGRDFLSYRRKSGAKIIIDINIAFSAENIVRDNTGKCFNYFGMQGILGKSKLDVVSFIKKTADVYVSGSSFVTQDLIENHSVSEGSIMTVNYGVNPKWTSGATIKEVSEQVNVVYVGSDDPRKMLKFAIKVANGIAETMSNKGFRFHIIGSSIKHPSSDHLEIINHGRLNQTQIKEIFEKSCLFVYPSVAEGSAGVVNEAMGSGLPVLVSYSSGAMVDDGKEGYILKNFELNNWINKGIEILSDPIMVKMMSKMAIEKSKLYSSRDFGARIIEKLQDIDFMKI